MPDPVCSGFMYFVYTYEGIKNMSEQTKKLCIAVFGTFLFAAGMNLFIVPIGLYSGGFLGIGQILRTILVTYIGLPIPGNIDIAGILLYIINIPLLILAYRHLGKRFFVSTIICVTIQTVFLTLIPSPKTPILEDKLAAAVVGGILAGYGTGITLQNGGSGGGQDILGLYLMQKDRSFSVGKITILINLFVYGACAIMFDFTIVIYSLIYVAVFSFVTDHTHAQNQNMCALIFTDHRSILDHIQNDFHRTATYWVGRGSYSRQERYVIYTALSKYECMKLRQMLKQNDPNAFVVFSNISDIFGKFDKHL